MMILEAYDWVTVASKLKYQIKVGQNSNLIIENLIKEIQVFVIPQNTGAKNSGPQWGRSRDRSVMTSHCDL